MAIHDIAQLDTSDLTNQRADYSVSPQETDGATGHKPNFWINTNWAQQLGYYKTIPELTAVIDAKATWTVGKGIEAEPNTLFRIKTILGIGTDTFNTILENMIRTYNIGGDAYAEIVRRPDEEDYIINLKPLDPGSIQIHFNDKGIITKYVQVSKAKGQKDKTFQPEQIFHLMRNRVADEIHGQSMIDAVEWIILAKNEAMTDMKRLMHRYVEPRFIFHLDTDDDIKIAAVKAKGDAANKNGENIYVPKGAVEPELVAVAPNATLSPLSWIESLDSKFYEAAAVPKIILGGAGAVTEAAVKIAYLAFQQTIEEEQLFIEEQVAAQLGYEINLVFPASLENEMLSDNKKDGAQNIDPSETTAGRGQ